jgi:hypothetical protein
MRLVSLSLIGFLLVSCSRAEKGFPTADGAASAFPGEKVLFKEVKDFEEGCVCFGAEIPVPCRLTPTGDLEVTMPPRTGKVDITFACGAGGPKTIAEDFLVKIPEPKEETPPVVTPPIVDGSPTPPPAPPAPPAPTPLTVSLDVDLTEVPGVLKISYNFQGGGNLAEAYLYGPFNRTALDAGCGKEGTRYLAVNPPEAAGGDLLDGSPNATTFADYLTGDLCDPAKGNCLNYIQAAGEPLSCRINLENRVGYFYTRMYQKSFRVAVAGKEAGGAPVTDSAAVQLGNPVVSLEKEGISCGPSQSGVSEEDCEGTVSLRWDVQRNYEIKKGAAGQVVDSGQAPWVKSVKLFSYVNGQGRWEEAESVTIKSNSDVGGSFLAKRDHAHTQWKLKAASFEGADLSSAVVKAGYQAKIARAGFEHTCLGKWEWDDPCDKQFIINFDGSCEKPGDGKWKYNQCHKVDYIFRGKHVRSVSVSCNKPALTTLFKTALQKLVGSYREKQEEVAVRGDYKSFSCTGQYVDFEGVTHNIAGLSATCDGYYYGPPVTNGENCDCSFWNACGITCGTFSGAIIGDGPPSCD